MERTTLSKPGGTGAFAYGIFCYGVFLGVFVYAVGFIGGFLTPTKLDGPATRPFWQALAIDLGLLGLFAVQHSVMARPAFKRWWTRFVPEAVERSTYVLFSSLALVALFAWWEPIGGIVWDATGAVRSIVIALYLLGWALLLYTTFLIDHFDLFGLKQVWRRLRGEAYVTAAILHAEPLQDRPPPALRRLADHLLGRADDDRRASRLRARDDRLHPHRHPLRGARPRRRLRRALRQLPTDDADADPTPVAPSAAGREARRVMRPLAPGRALS